MTMAWAILFFCSLHASADLSVATTFAPSPTRVAPSPLALERTDSLCVDPKRISDGESLLAAEEEDDLDDDRIALATLPAGPFEVWPWGSASDHLFLTPALARSACRLFVLRC